MGHTCFQSGRPGWIRKLEKLFPSFWHAGPLLPLQTTQRSSLCLKRALSQLTTNTEQFFPFDVSPQSSQRVFLHFRNSLSVAQESAVGWALPASSGLVSVELELLPGSFVLPVTSVCIRECACACACVRVCVCRCLPLCPRPQRLDFGRGQEGGKNGREGQRFRHGLHLRLQSPHCGGQP